MNGFNADWIGSYIERLAPFGLKVPSGYEAARERVPWLGHTAAMVAFGAWPLQFWRFYSMTAGDMDWFELKYPGLVWLLWQILGGISVERRDPRNGELALSLFSSSAAALPRVPDAVCVPRIDISTCRTKEFAGKRHAFCSASCEMFFDQEPQRYLGYTSFYELFDGYDLADFVVENGLLKS